MTILIALRADATILIGIHPRDSGARFKLLLFFYRQKFLSLSWRDKQHHVYDLNGKMNEFKKTGYSLVNHVALNHSDIEIVLTGC